MRFEWDAEKNRLNQQKHDGIAFESAAFVFVDPAVSGAVLLVVHVYRMENEYDKEETVRIISAREADKRERRIYIQQARE
jgi:uncharacterized DUF497 family protein